MAQARKAGKPAETTGYKAEVPEGERAAVTTLLSEIQRAKAIFDQSAKTMLADARRYTYGTKHGEKHSTASSARTNLIFATQATLLPHIYAKNPEIAVTPTEAVSESDYENIKSFCKTAQVALNRLFVEEAGLKKRSKSNVRSTMTTGVGWLKLTYQESLSGDPLILRRHNDLQDNLQRVEHLARQQKDKQEFQQSLAQRTELQQQISAIFESDEVKIFKGLALDRVQTEDVLILDESVVDFDDYAHAKKLALGIWMTVDEYEQKFHHAPGPQVTKFGNAESGDNGATINFPEGAAKKDFVRVWQVEDKHANLIHTVVEGGNRYCRQPFTPKPTAERFYSLYCLGFNLVEGRWRPISDVELLKVLQDEYNDTRYLYAEARREAIPTRVFRKSGSLTEEDIKNLSTRRARDWIGVEGNPTVPLDQDVLQLEGIAIDPAAYDVTLIRNDMDMLVGLSDASRANLIEAKTATEAEIMRQALMTRVAERQDANEDLITEMARAALEIMLQKFDESEIKQLCGADAVWPKMAPEEIFRMVSVSVRAGSTGKPNVQKEREAWNTVMPILKDTIAQVAELRMAGNFDMADSLIELLKETLQRYDERLDVERFIPRQEKDAEGNPIQQNNAMQQAAQAQEQLVALQEELQQCKEALATCEQQLMIAKQNDQEAAAKMEADAAIATAQESTKQAAENAKATEAQAKAQAEKEFKLEQHRETLRSQEKQARLSAATDWKIARAKIIADALKPQPTKGADGETQPGKPIDIDELLRKINELDNTGEMTV
jgi:hypothetical protein